MRTPNVQDPEAFIKSMRLRYIEDDGYPDSTPIDICNINCLIELVEAYREERSTREL
jgi:hypothetical protein